MLTLYFVRNLTSEAWIGNPIHGALEVDFEDAHPYVSLGDAMSVMDQLERKARAATRRITGFFSRREPDAFDIVDVMLAEPGDDEIVDAVGEMIDAPADRFHDEHDDED